MTRLFRPTLPRLLSVVVSAALVVAVQGPAYATWSVNGSSAASGVAAIMPTGNKPTTRSGTNSVTVVWTAATFVSGAPVGYVITRYDATTGIAQAVHGTCSGIVAATTCTDQLVPAGTWTYSNRPVLANWNGGESPRSTAITLSAG